MLQENQGYGLHEENADYKVVEEIGTTHCQRIMLKLGGSHQTFEVVQVRLTRLAKQIVSIMLVMLVVGIERKCLTILISSTTLLKRCLTFKLENGLMIEKVQCKG